MGWVIIMKIVWVAILLGMLVMGIGVSAIATIWSIKEDRSRISFVLVFLNYVIAFVICVYNTALIRTSTDLSPIGMDGKPLTLGTLIGCVFLWGILAVLTGTVLAVISENISMVYAAIKKDKRAFSRSDFTPGFSSGTVSGICAGAIATGYSMILYILGLTSSFFPFL